MDHIIHTQLNELNSCKLGGVSQSPANLFGGRGERRQDVLCVEGTTPESFYE